MMCAALTQKHRHPQNPGTRNSQFHRLSAANAPDQMLTCAIEVGRDPVAEIEKMGREAARMRSIAVSRAAPPATSTSGSRLPWTGRCGGSAASAQAGSTVSSNPIASTRVSSARREACRSRGKTDHRRVGMDGFQTADDFGIRRDHQRSNCAGLRLPAQLSNNCTASTPCSIWPAR